MTKPVETSLPPFRSLIGGLRPRGGPGVKRKPAHVPPFDEHLGTVRFPVNLSRSCPALREPIEVPSQKLGAADLLDQGQLDQGPIVSLEKQEQIACERLHTLARSPKLGQRSAGSICRGQGREQPTANQHDQAAP